MESESPWHLIYFLLSIALAKSIRPQQRHLQTSATLWSFHKDSKIPSQDFWDQHLFMIFYFSKSACFKPFLGKGERIVWIQYPLYYFHRTERKPWIHICSLFDKREFTGSENVWNCSWSIILAVISPISIVKNSYTVIYVTENELPINIVYWCNSGCLVQWWTRHRCCSLPWRILLSQDGTLKTQSSLLTSVIYSASLMQPRILFYILTFLWHVIV